VAAARPPVEETTMRTRTVAALTLLLALGPAGCARTGDEGTGVATARSGGATPGASPSASASSDPDAPLKFARCMREHGLTWFPDPSKGGTTIRIPDGTDPKKMKAAQEACKQFRDGGTIDKPPAADIEAMRQVAKCMRENGVPKFPDPQPDGGLAVDGAKIGMGPGDPTFDKADKICSKYQPKGAVKNTERGSGGAGTTGRTS
jgi:hypothetical protein